MKTLVSLLTSFMGQRTQRPRTRALVYYALMLFSVVLLYGWLFHVIMAHEGQEHSWFTGVYWALTVMSTLGFGDITFTSDLGRAFSTFVLVTGVVMLLIILPFLFIRMVYAPWLDQRNRSRWKALRRIPREAEGHVVICANDPIALGLIRRLELAGVPAYLIEPDPNRAIQMHDEGVPVIAGEVDSIETYENARIERARLVFANSSDTVNTNIVLTVRERAPAIPVVAIADSVDSVDILELGGVNHVLTLTLLLGEHLAKRVSAGNVRANIIGHFHQSLLAEFPVKHTPLEGRTIRDSGLREELGVNVVGVWHEGRLLPADPDLELSSLSVPVVIASEEQVETIDAMLIIHEANTNPVIIIGGGRVGRAAAETLKQNDVKVHVVERSRDLEAELIDIPDRLFIGDAADRSVLDAAGIQEAPSILLTTHDDAMNVYLTVYCRRLNPEARILTRVTHERNIDAIQRAGANYVLSYASLGVQIVTSIVRDRELIVLGEGVEVYYIPLPKQLAGKTLAETGIGARAGLNVIGIDQDGQVRTDLTAGQVLESGCTLVTIGGPEQRRAFQQLYE
jgi:Trk K+ transport system NAD-binding subunit